MPSRCGARPVCWPEGQRQCRSDRSRSAGRDEQNLFRDRRHPRRGRPVADHTGLHPQPRPRGRTGAQGHRDQADRADRQGHPHLGLHDRVGARGRLRLGGRRRAAHRPAADPRRRLPDAGAAPEPRARHQRLAQPVRRQRHQVLLASRREAVRCLGARGRGGDEAVAAVGRFGRPRPGAPARRCAGPLHRVLQEHLQRRAVAQGHEDRRRRRPRRGLSRCARRLPRTGRRGGVHRLLAERRQHQCRVRRHRAAGAGRRGAQPRCRLRHRSRRRRRPAAAGRCARAPLQRRRVALHHGGRPAEPGPAGAGRGRHPDDQPRGRAGTAPARGRLRARTGRRPLRA